MNTLIKCHRQVQLLFTSFNKNSISASQLLFLVLLTISTTTAVHALIPDVGRIETWSSKAFIRLDFPAPVSPTTAIIVRGNVVVDFCKSNSCFLNDEVISIISLINNSYHYRQSSMMDQDNSVKYVVLLMFQMINPFRA